jgi:hypothetical protein
MCLGMFSFNLGASGMRPETKTNEKDGDGPDFVLLHGEGYRAGRNGGMWQETPPPGDYSLVLDSRHSSGTLSVYIGSS